MKRALLLGTLVLAATPAGAATFPIVAIDLDPNTPLVIDSARQFPGPVPFMDVGVIVDARGSTGIGDIARVVFGCANPFNTGGAVVTGITPLSIVDIMPPPTAPNNAAFAALAGELQFGGALVERGVPGSGFSGGPVRYAVFRVLLGSLPAGSTVPVFVGDRGPGTFSVRDAAGADISGDAGPDATPIFGTPGSDEGTGAKVDYRDAVATFGVACGVSPAPQCGGGCPAGQECLSDLAGHSCSCVPGPVSCGDADAPECDGECPPGQLCAAEATGTACACANLPACGQASAPECGGSCPTGQDCVLDAPGSGCACKPRPVRCLNAAAPVCGGDCPNGYLCQDSGGACQCLPSTVVCGDASAPRCDGFCPAGTGCRTDPAGAGCLCAPLDQPCAQSAAPVCGGRCDDGRICVPGAGGISCSCQAVPCAGSPSPECGGSCAAGQICRSDGAAGCTCQPEELPCGQSQIPQCGGTCPSGEVCELNSFGVNCVCQPVAQPCGSSSAPVCGGRCQNATDRCISDAAGGSCFCSPPILTCGQSTFPQCGGFCANGETCVAPLAAGLCECVPLQPECDGPTIGAPVCGGLCSNGQQCMPNPQVQGRCLCSDCATVGPYGPIEVAWAGPTDLVWSALECAARYDVYRDDFDRMVDGDGDGLADTYPGCYAPNLQGRQLTDNSNPKPGRFFAYIVAGENANGDNGLGDNSAGVARPNRRPCP